MKRQLKLVHVRQKKRRKNVRMNDESREAFGAIIERVSGNERLVFEDMLAVYLDEMKNYGIHLPLVRRPQRQMALWYFGDSWEVESA